MAKSKKNPSNTPRRKRYNRNARLQNAKKWAEQYDGKNIAKGYSNWFGVDLLCAITELEMLGYKFKQTYKKQVEQSLIARQKQKESRKRKEVAENYEDDIFYFIAGYTSNGVPFGVTREEMENDEGKTSRAINKDKIIFYKNNEDLPF
ncbi:hypothetical protein QFZ28_002914 [Neobacillus niacini]|uniref:hypothetical protein n=1 Tax=Neobacillus niacini TaxID=86668 RepID=UPI00277E9405|nr:hypothetical protein [Neobacillus niacini]MDQ1002514.1 hypothetical protein [Neobacillus niacini]